MPLSNSEAAKYEREALRLARDTNEAIVNALLAIAYTLDADRQPRQRGRGDPPGPSGPGGTRVPRNPLNPLPTLPPMERPVPAATPAYPARAMPYVEPGSAPRSTSQPTL